MLLAIDIGNTNISIGSFRGKKIMKKFLSSKGAIRRYIKGVDKVIIVSVAPKRLKEVLKKND